MEKRTRISANIKFKKYFISWFVILVAYIITSLFNLNQFWDYVTWTLAILVFLLYASLKKLEYTDAAVFFNNQHVDYKSITALKSFEINGITYYLFKTTSNSFLKRFYFTQLEGIGYFSILKIIFSKNNSKELPIAEFLMLLDEKSNISKN